MRGLRTVVLFVADLPAATAWYRRVIGHDPYYDTPYYVGFDVEGYELGLHPEGEGQRAGVGGERAYWGAEDAAAEVERLVGLGARVLEPVQDVGGGIRIGSVVDPFGNALGVIQNPAFHADVVVVVGPGEKLGAARGDESPRTIVKRAVVPASPAQVWALWTTSTGMASWLVPAAHIELRIGGAYELYFLESGPKGAQGSEGCRVLAYLPERMLTVTWNAPPEHVETRPQRTWVVLELEPLAEGTRVTLTHLGWPASGLADPEGPWSKTYAYFDEAWGWVLDRLGKHLG